MGTETRHLANKHFYRTRFSYVIHSSSKRINLKKYTIILFHFICDHNVTCDLTVDSKIDSVVYDFRGDLGHIVESKYLRLERNDTKRSGSRISFSFVQNTYQGWPT